MATDTLGIDLNNQGDWHALLKYNSQQHSFGKIQTRSNINTSKLDSSVNG
jgi:hypothetical protein